MQSLQRFGILGKTISKLFQDSDIAALKTTKAVATLRPRGILSGYLVIADTIQFVPPPTAKQTPISLRMRIASDMRDIVFSAYMENGDIVIEDVLVWRGKQLTTGFEERWKYVGDFATSWQPDGSLQGCTVRFAEYTSLAELQEPSERQVVEFVPLTPNTKRLDWIPVAEAAAKTIWIAKREGLVGPDIFSLWCPTTGEKQGMALVRTLAVSRGLRQHPVDEFRVQTVWNKMFERWEILGIS
jgi:hypothetical protein